jgi:hypothetical protein
MAMEMSLFGLELMNFRYGIEEEMLKERSRKVSRICFRDSLVWAFNCGMRKRKEVKEEIRGKWDKNIGNIRKLVEGCLYLSV